MPSALFLRRPGSNNLNATRRGRVAATACGSEQLSAQSADANDPGQQTGAGAANGLSFLLVRTGSNDLNAARMSAAAAACGSEHLSAQSADANDPGQQTGMGDFVRDNPFSLCYAFKKGDEPHV